MGKRRFPSDDTELQNTEEKLRKCDQLLKDIQRITRLGNWEWDIHTNTVTWSDELYRIFALRREDFAATFEAYLNRIHPEDRAQSRSAIELALQNKRPFIFDHRIVRPDGTVRFLETEGEVKTDDQGQPVQMLGCCLDVTERKQTEKKLATSISLLNATLESTADGILVVDLAGNLARYNSKFMSMWRLPSSVMETYQDKRALSIALKQLKDPIGFMDRVRYLYQHPELDSFDVLEFKDGRIFERFSHPQRIGEKIIGRVWSFRDATDRYRVLETLRESEQRYRSLIIATAQVVWRTDSEGIMLDDAASCRQFTGQPAMPSENGHWLNSVHPEDRTSAAETWFHAVAARSIYETEYRVRRADGQWRNMIVRGVPLLEKSGAIREWVGFCQDITERKRAQEAIIRERNFMDALINSLPGIFYLLDQTGLNLRWNKNLETISEYSGAEIAGMHAIDFVPEEEKQMLAERVRKVFTEGHASAKIHVVSKTGKRVLYLCTGTRVELEGKPSLVGMGIDISQLEKAKNEIKKLNRDLGRRVQERTAQLNTINKELEAFSYSVSHDLRAPLRAISGFAKVIKEEHGGQLNEEGNLFVDKILQAGDRMSHLIDDLLTYSRIGRSAIILHPISLNNLLHEIVNDFANRIKSIGGTLFIDPHLPAVNGDSSLLGQVFTNLFENAITYRKPDVPLKLSVTARHEADRTVICVSDNGIGIAPAHHQRIFEVFQRLHTNQQYPGTGIGLANAKKSIEILGGQIWVESELDRGSTFCIALKSATPESSQPKET
jgi:PAS domain S-box-containing protein